MLFVHCKAVLLKLLKCCKLGFHPDPLPLAQYFFFLQSVLVFFFCSYYLLGRPVPASKKLNKNSQFLLPISGSASPQCGDGPGIRFSSFLKSSGGSNEMKPAVFSSLIHANAPSVSSEVVMSWGSFFFSFAPNYLLSMERSGRLISVSAIQDCSAL